MTTNDAVRPVAWRLMIGSSDMWSYAESEDDADFYGKQPGLPYVKEPLYPPTAIAHLQARVEALTGEVAKWKELASESVYVGLCIGHDCASMLATLQERGDYNPRYNADARADANKIQDIYSRGLRILNPEYYALTQPEADHG
jgi:hypothetical protein